MHDTAVSTSKLITAALWSWVGSLFVAAWLTWALAKEDGPWMMLAFTGCMSSALAATSQIRCYTLKLCGLLRASKGIEGPFAADLHSLS